MRGVHVVVTAVIVVVVVSLNTKYVTSFTLLHPTLSSIKKNIPPKPVQQQQHQQRYSQERTGELGIGGIDQPQQIISPFDHSGDNNDDNGSSNNVAATTTTILGNEILDLTYENVELVLDSMRHFLIQDGGNVIIDEIDGPIVKLQLQGNCGTCPSSTQTMKMGLERGLKERIPEIQEVIQSLPEGPPLESEQIEIVLDGVRPFLQIVGGTIVLDRIDGLDSIQPSIVLQMSGSSASLNSVKLEIAQRLQRHFMMSGLQIHWKGE